jgi:hypothetical protein
MATTLNRRLFLKTASATGAIVMISPAALILDGCDGSAVINLINVALQAAENVLAVVEPGAPWVGNFQAAITALKNAETTWQSGGAVQIVIDALNTLVAVTAVIPLTAVYSPLIDILVAGIEAVLAALPASTTAKLSRNPHYGHTQLKKPHLLQSKAGAFKQQWNDVVNANPALAKAKL